MNNLNAGFLLDIWADLKEKRLAPVAIGLVVALIAIPTLMKKDGDATEVPLPLAVPSGSDAPKVQVAEELADGGSKLDSYEARDPFKGLGKGPAPAETGTGAATSPSDLLDEGGSSGSDGGSSSGSTEVTGSTGIGDAGATGDSGGSGDGGSGDAEVPTVPTAPEVKHETAFYNFRLDVKFGKPGREKRYRDLSRLSFLPSPTLPVALFMGVNEEQDKALFFVYPGLNHQGEGVCIPKPTNCDFLQLEEGKEHYFSANDLEFHMELLDVKKVKASKEKQERKEARKAAERSARTGDDGAGADDAQADSYEWPWLVDGIG